MSTAARYPVATPRADAYDAADSTVPNGDIGRPQRAFVFLEEADLVRGPVLDVGCGTGELSVFLARAGHDVLGIDVAPTAIAQAREKAHWRRVAARFLVWDALDLAGLADAGFAFRTVVDSGMFHQLDAGERDRFVDALSRVLGPGGAYFVLGDARTDPGSGYGIDPAELASRFSRAAGWAVAFVAETTFERRDAASPAYLAGVVRRDGSG